MKVFSSSLADGRFAVDCGGHGRNLSPAFTVADAPEGTASLALLLEDRDAGRKSSKCNKNLARSFPT